MHGYIYKTTNLINNKIYFGQCSKDINKSKEYLGSGKYITRAIKKYGKDNFKKDIVKRCYNQVSLDNWEMFCIMLGKNNKYGCYNITIGGNCVMHGRKHSDTTKQKMSITQTKIQKEIQNRIEVKNKKSISRSKYKCTEEQKENIRNGQLKNNTWNKGRKGKQFSKDIRNKISINVIEWWKKRKSNSCQIWFTKKIKNIKKCFKPNIEAKLLLDKFE